MIINNWKMTYGDYHTLDCKAPCSMYGVLLENGLIEDPFYGMNERTLAHLSDSGCVFETEIEIDDELLKHSHLELVFLGIDTICSIFVNGKLLAKTKNMHRRYIFDIKHIAHLGKNQIRLELSSPTQYFKEMNEKHFLMTNGDTIPGAAHLRKALYMSGWDWGPTLPDMGIFRPIILDAYDIDKIDSIHVRQNHTQDAVVLDIEVETRHNTSADIFVEIDDKRIKLNNKKGTITIENPRLWWARGYGEQNLYTISAELWSNGEKADEKSQSIGLRTLTVSTTPDEDGSEFCFVLNGVKIFAMGANYVPQDNIISRITREGTEELLKIALDANFNCIRIWGGGYYPEDYFYDLCDSYGLLVWQDSMVACCNVWLTDEMTEEFEQETIYNLKRLRHHPSLALWCGNNEMEEAIVNWRDYDGDNPEIRSDYLRLYESIIPALVSEYAPDIFYWQASPSSGGGFDEPNSTNRGDTHFWDAWHGDKSFTEYRKHKFRFCSEYGFESYPSMKTIKTFCPEEEMNCFSRVMENHQKCKSGNRKILMYIADNYLYPNSLDSLVYTSQLLQADAIKYGVEHFRRNRGYTMGSIYWQFNDCWQVASWSSVDSLGRRKALHYAAKRFYAPVAMGLFLEGDTLSVNISNESMQDFNGKVKVCFSDTSRGILREHEVEVRVSALTSSDVLTLDARCENENSEFIIAELYSDTGSLVMRQSELYVKPKHFEWKRPSFNVDISRHSNVTTLEITADTFAKGVYIDFEDCDPEMSDNFIDLPENQKHQITLKTDKTPSELLRSIRIMSVYDIGR